MTVAASPPSRWVHGPIPDLFLGCGLAYLLVFGVLVGFGPEVRALAPLTLLPLVATFTGTPHYGATLLRVYESRRDRRAYALFSVWATLLLAGAFLAGLHSVLLGSLLFTVYLTWSPWHYTGQNYGLGLLFLRRRGVPVTPGLKRLLYASFILSYALTLVAIHVEAPAAAYAPEPLVAPTFRFLPAGIPSAIYAPLVVGLALAYAGTLGAAAMLLLRRAAARDLLPTALLALTQSVWFAIPVLARASGLGADVDPLSLRYASYAFMYAAFAHGVQYLWITSYYARSSEPRVGRYLLRCLLAGGALWGVPALLFAPGALGPLPYDGGLYVLIASVVNLHHFILDGAIWKLRDGRVARILIRSEPPEPADAEARSRPAWVAPLVFAVGGVCVVVAVAGVLETEFGVIRAAAAGNLERMQDAARRLAWIGRESPQVHLLIAEHEIARGGRQAALAHLERSLALQPSARAWLVKANTHLEVRDFPAAVEAYRAVLAQDPEHVDALYHFAYALLGISRRGEAIAALEQAARIAPERADVREALDHARGRPAGHGSS